MISLLVCSRFGGNQNSSLFNLLDSLKESSSDFKNFEVLIKFDTDDETAPKFLNRFESYPFTIRYLIEPRGRGYIDLHVFYNRLFSIADEKSSIIGAVGDDFIITQKNWDELILAKSKEFADGIFMIHGRPHPPFQRSDYLTQKFFLEYDIDRSEDLEIIDEAPLWSRELLNICGGLGHLSFTDLWTLMLEYYLHHRCKLNRTVFLDQPFVHRVQDPKIDTEKGSRWTKDRANNFAYARSVWYKTMVEYQALNIYAQIKMRELSLVPPPITPKQFSIEIPKLGSRPFMDKVKRAALDAFPPSFEPKLREAYAKLTGRKYEKPYLPPN